MNVAILEELEPVIVQGIIGHVSVYYAAVALWRHNVAEGRLTAREAARLKRVARYRLERYISGKLRQQREAGRAGVTHQ